MTKLNLSPTGQFGFKQPNYIIPESQGANVGCNALSLIGSDVESNFVRNYLFVKIPLQIPRGLPELGTLAPYQVINIENIDRDTNLELFDIISDEKRLLLRKPIEVTPDFRDGMWIMENKDFDIISMSTDYEECLRDFHDEVFFVYEEYGQEDDDKLTNGAKELKRKILQYVYRKVGVSSIV